MGVKKSLRNLENRFSVSDVCEALDTFYGLIQPAARRLKCSRMSLYNYIEKHPELKKNVQQGREKLLDRAESILIQILDGSLDASTGEKLEAAKYIMSTIGKTRGYTTKTESEVTGKNGTPLAPIVVNIPSEITDEKNDGKRPGN